jgi:large subunit ribosomal protein L19
MAEEEKTPAQPEAQAEPVAEETAEVVQQAAAEEAAPAEDVTAQELRPGMTVRVHQKITEGDKQRIQIFQGIITAMRGKTPVTKTITVQKSSFGIMVEKIFPVGSPLIEKIQVVKIAKVRRSKLYFLKEYSKRLKETLVKA